MKDKLKIIILAILGGIDVTLTIFMPILIAALWVTSFGLNDWTSYFFYGIGLLSTLFRAIKVGFMNNG